MASMTGAWTPDSEPTSTDGSVTLVEGSSFCLCTPHGRPPGRGAARRLLPGHPHPVALGPHGGRSASGTPRRAGPRSLPRDLSGPPAAIRPDRHQPAGRAGAADRERDPGGRHDSATPARSRSPAPSYSPWRRTSRTCSRSRRGGSARVGERTARAENQRLVLGHGSGESHRGVIVEAPGGAVTAVRRGADHPLRRGGPGRRPVVRVAGRPSRAGRTGGRAVLPARPVRRRVVARRAAPDAGRSPRPSPARVMPGLQGVLRRSQEDLGALRIFDDEDPTLAAVAAGAPWFMALFGRDSLLSAYMALPLDPSLALGTLKTLARHQGSRSDPRTEEEPGRIVHEVRHGIEAGLSLGGGGAYYGTADADSALRRAARGARPVGRRTGADPSAAPARRPGSRVDRAVRRPGRRWLRGVPAVHRRMGFATRDGRTPGTA